MSSISETLRQQVSAEAGHCCEYCRTCCRIIGMPFFQGILKLESHTLIIKFFCGKKILVSKYHTITYSGSFWRVPQIYRASTGKQRIEIKYEIKAFSGFCCQAICQAGEIMPSIDSV